MKAIKAFKVTLAIETSIAIVAITASLASIAFTFQHNYRISPVLQACLNMVNKPIYGQYPCAPIMFQQYYSYSRNNSPLPDPK